MSLLLVILLQFQNNCFAADSTLKIGGGTLKVSLPDEGLAVSKKAELDWLTHAANAVTNYFGHYPVKNVSITIKDIGPGSHISGTTWAGRTIELRLGADVTDGRLATDWTATHEMFHLAFPMVDGQDWMGEGLATYLEPLARTRIGDLKAEQIWSDMIDGLPKGRPASGDQGLNRTHTWGRIYWGGALFWFVADIQIREKTKNKKSLDTAMRAILDAGGDGSSDWSQEKIFERLDQATGVNVIKDLKEKMVNHPGDVDLDQLWKRLGISRKSDHIVYDNKAPLADIRKAMTTETGNSSKAKTANK